MPPPPTTTARRLCAPWLDSVGCREPAAVPLELLPAQRLPPLPFRPRPFQRLRAPRRRQPARRATGRAQRQRGAAPARGAGAQPARAEGAELGPCSAWPRARRNSLRVGRRDFICPSPPTHPPTHTHTHTDTQTRTPQPFISPRCNFLSQATMLSLLVCFSAVPQVPALSRRRARRRSRVPQARAEGREAPG